MTSYIGLFACLGFLLLATGTESAGDGAKWSYEGNTGPVYWHLLENGGACNGTSQSPINIETDSVMMAEYSNLEFVGYDTAILGTSKAINNGHTAQLNVQGDFQISGAGLPKTYKVLQLHFHWAEENDKGSEHIKNGNAYPLEMHIVHYDAGELFPLDAVIKPEGLAVLGVWFEVDNEDDNAAFTPIIEILQNIKYSGSNSNLTSELMLQDLLPSNIENFYRYSGSLTTPGCYQSVVWTVFDETVKVSQAQLDKFRELLHNVEGDTDGDKAIGMNYRPFQLLNDRTVYSSFSSGMESTTIESTTAGSVRNIPSLLVLSVLSAVYLVLGSC